VLAPFVAEVDAVLADDWETGFVSDVEACCANDDVDFSLDAVFGEAGDGSEVDGDVGLLDGFDLGVSGRYAAAA
jgi:hypothetical protein